MSSKGSFDYTFEEVKFRGDVLASVDVTVDFQASAYDPGHTGGTPETDYPPEGGEVEDIKFTITRVVVGHTEMYAEHGGEDVEWTGSQLTEDGPALLKVIEAIYDKNEDDYEAIDSKVGEIMVDRHYHSDPYEYD